MRPGPSGAGPGMHAGKLDGRGRRRLWGLITLFRLQKNRSGCHSIDDHLERQPLLRIASFYLEFLRRYCVN